MFLSFTPCPWTPEGAPTAPYFTGNSSMFHCVICVSRVGEQIPDTISASAYCLKSANPQGLSWCTAYPFVHHHLCVLYSVFATAQLKQHLVIWITELVCGYHSYLGGNINLELSPLLIFILCVLTLSNKTCKTISLKFITVNYFWTDRRDKERVSTCSKRLYSAIIIDMMMR